MVGIEALICLTLILSCAANIDMGALSSLTCSSQKIMGQIWGTGKQTVTGNYKNWQ